jgi:hypothetical protein
MDLPACPTYTFLHSHGIRYTPGTFKTQVILDQPEHMYILPFWYVNGL